MGHAPLGRLVIALVPALAPLATAPAASAADPVIAAAGDVACDPASTSFNGGAGDATHCRQRATSDVLLSGGFAAVLPLGVTQYADGTLDKFTTTYDPSCGR